MICMRGFVLTIFLCFLFSGIGHAQTDSISRAEKIEYDRETRSPISFDREQIESYKKDAAFDYVEKIQKENWWGRFKDWAGRVWNQFWDWLLGSYTPSGIIAFILKILPYVILAAILGFILWLFIKLNPAASALKEQRQPGIHFSEDEKILQREDISSLIQQALQQQNYRLAVRYHYLLVLKKMRDRGLIEYQFQKTNEEYLSEIEPLSLKNQFKNITHLYDFIWYGDFPVTESDFKKAETEFTKIIPFLNTDPLGKTN